MFPDLAQSKQISSLSHFLSLYNFAYRKKVQYLNPHESLAPKPRNIECEHEASLSAANFPYKQDLSQNCLRISPFLKVEMHFWHEKRL